MNALINRETGKPPTETEMKAIIKRAVAIFCNPYASPEQLEWAINVYPEGFADAFDYSETIHKCDTPKGVVL